MHTQLLVPPSLPSSHLPHLVQHVKRALRDVEHHPLTIVGPAVFLRKDLREGGMEEGREGRDVTKEKSEREKKNVLERRFLKKGRKGTREGGRESRTSVHSSPSCAQALAIATRIQYSKVCGLRRGRRASLLGPF